MSKVEVIFGWNMRPSTLGEFGVVPYMSYVVNGAVDWAVSKNAVMVYNDKKEMIATFDREKVWGVVKVS